MRTIFQFLVSDHFFQMPQLAISARIFAQLRHLARNGAYSNREKATDKLGGAIDDRRHVATYAPYCEAIFVDKAMASILLEPKVGVKSVYGTEVFSLNSLDEFHSWLDGIEAAASPEHFRDLESVYGNRA